jgi:hypothetical protein
LKAQFGMITTTQTQADATTFARQMLVAMKLSFQNLGSGEARVQVIEPPAKKTDLAVIGRVVEHELRELLRHRAQVNRRIVVLRKTIRAVLGDEAVRDSRTPAAIRLTPRKREGITHTCRLVLTQASLPMTVREVAEAIRSSYPSAAASQRHLLASVSAVLRYLLESGEANNTFNDDGNRAWFAVRPPRENDLST